MVTWYVILYRKILLSFSGLTTCDIFHALDILASTSSIWNLCVISLDRYMAGQDPIGYRDKVMDFV